LSVWVGLLRARPKREFAVIKRSADPKQIQSWAMEVLRQFPDGSNESRLIASNVPAFFQKIPAFGAVGPEVVVSSGGPEVQRCVKLIYFYGGWGNGQTILAGTPAFTHATNSRCILWAPGVYYIVW